MAEWYACYCVLTTIGALALLNFLYGVFKLVRSAFGGGVSLKKFGAGSGAWAVVTGASDGIGKSFAKQLAKRGFNILLISRTESKLKAVAEEIAKESSGVQTKYVVADLTKNDAAKYKEIADVVASLDVGVLVNNAGLSFEYPERYLEVDPQLVRDIVALNISAVNEITRIVLPGMVSKKRGLVINISSASSIVPSPLLSVYSASKAYLDYWSQSLAAEYRRDGIVVDCQVPFFVVSNMSKRSRPTTFIPMPDTYVRAALAKVGSDTLYAPYFPHALLAWGMNLLPKSFLINKNKGLHEDIRRRALAKKKSQ